MPLHRNRFESFHTRSLHPKGLLGNRFFPFRVLPAEGPKSETDTFAQQSGVIEPNTIPSGVPLPVGDDYSEVPGLVLRLGDSLYCRTKPLCCEVIRFSLGYRGLSLLELVIPTLQ